MGKKNKESEEVKVDWQKEAALLREQNIALVKQNRYAHYLTISQFMKEYSGALEEYLRAQYRSDEGALMHPEDLAASAATFSDAWWTIVQHTDVNARGVNIGKP